MTVDSDILGKPLTRPWCCPDPRWCVMLYQVRDSSSQPLNEPQPGQSFMCWGQMPEEIEFKYDGVIHANDLRSCSYTPLKGVMTWQENDEDWEVLAYGYTTARERLGEERSV